MRVVTNGLQRCRVPLLGFTPSVPSGTDRSLIATNGCATPWRMSRRTSLPQGTLGAVASTNPLERLNGEVKRRADVVGVVPNNRAVVRLVGALMLEQNDEWLGSRRHMSLESLAPLSNNPANCRL